MFDGVTHEHERLDACLILTDELRIDVPLAELIDYGPICPPFWPGYAIRVGVREIVRQQRSNAPRFTRGSGHSIGVMAAMCEWTWSTGDVDRRRMLAMELADLEGIAAESSSANATARPENAVPIVSKVHQIPDRRWMGLVTAAVALILGSTAAFAGAFVEPSVFASSHGELDLLMIAQPQPVPSITYNPPDSSPPLNPIGWVYTVCPRAVSLPGNQCPASSPTVSNYGGVRLALQKGNSLKIRLVNRLPALAICPST
jgi:hypothetical protein